MPTMHDVEEPSRRTPRDIDISRPTAGHWLRGKRHWLWLTAVLLLFYVYFALGGMHVHGWLAWLVPVTFIVVVTAPLAWVLIVRRGVLTWIRLARAPARAMARGDAAEAERALQKALARARRFRPHDQRRGLMLVGLAEYVKYQGRYDEANALYSEAVEILGQHRRSGSLDYFVALNNYAIFFIHLRDHASAQRMLERALDLTLLRKKTQPDPGVVKRSASAIELVLHLNLIFLFIEMGELGEARSHREEVDDIFDAMTRRQQARYEDHYRAVRALLLYAQGAFANAEAELDRAPNPEYPACLRVRTKLRLVRQDFAQAENLLRKFLDQERKKGSLHRPELRDHTLELAESLFGQGRMDEAFQALDEARAIVADFALPPSASWGHALHAWRHRARDLGRTETATALDAELMSLQATPEHGITVSDKLRVQRPNDSSLS
jgi:tetratricopeptide (TPR) repeat protein